MNETPFITRPLSIALDVVRALAALVVLVGHARQLGHYNGAWPFSVLFQHNAVIVFFVLSGLVIAASVDRARRAGAPQTLTSFTLARASRILPVALPALLLSLAVIAIDSLISPVVYFREDAWGIPTSDLLYAVLFLSESYQTGLPLNPPYWSLCYEVWFYALFAAATFLDGWKRVIWLTVLAAIAGPNILLMLPVWLAGVALARLPIALRVPAWLAPALVLAAGAALHGAPMVARWARLALDGLIPWNPGFATYALSDLGLAICIALGFAGLRTLTLKHGAWLERIDRPVRWFANMSFSLYLLHWPLLKLTRVLRAPDQGAVGFAIVVAGIVVLCGAFAAVTEHRRHAVHALLERALGGWRAAPAAA
jgi:peptidoglycan/LPS O-acetylase OafA/YrhL